MLRSFFLYLSQADWAKNLIMKIGPARRSAHRFVAGDTLAEAIEVVRQLNASGLEVTLDHLGESVTDEAGAQQATQAYFEMIDAIAASGVRATAFAQADPAWPGHPRIAVRGKSALHSGTRQSDQQSRHD